MKAVITGGGGAIAAEIAVRLEAKGYDLVLADVNPERMAETAAQVRQEPTLIDVDLSTSDGITNLAAAIEGDHADLDLLVNNVGYIEPGDIATIDAEILDRHIAINLLAPMQMTRAAVRVMRPRRRGDILSIVSMGGIIAMRGSASYSAGKFGLRGYLMSVRSELGRDRVRVMGVYPSAVDTPMLRHEATHGGSPLNFVGKVFEPAEVADVAMKALRTGKLENYLPYSDSVTTRFFASFPWLIDRVLPRFEAKGERGRARFLSERGLTSVD